MNIPFDKTLLWGLPYLYLVSISYYWGFWGTFDIDAFSYYAVSDIVKGITAPISSALVYLVTLVAALLFMEFVDNIAGKRFKLVKILLASTVIIALLFLAISSGYFTQLRTNTRIIDDKLSAIEYTVYTACLLVAGTTLFLSVKKDKANDNIFYYSALV